MSSLKNANKTGITNVRRVLLDFLKSTFAADSTYTWTQNPANRKIDIVNEFDIVGKRKIEVYPKVVLTRGDIGLRNIGLNRAGDIDTLFQPDTKYIQDLASGTVVLNILSKQAIEAEILGEKIMYDILAYRDEIRWSQYILKITDISLGTIQPVTVNSDVRVYQVPLYIRYDKEINFAKTYDYYDVDLTIDGTRQHQTTDFYIFDNLVFFVDAPASGVDFEMSYYHRSNMSGITEVPLYPPDGARTVFPFSYPIYGPYYMISGVDFTIYEISGVDTFYNSSTLYKDLDVTFTQESGPRVHRQGHSYILPGQIDVEVGDANHIPPFYISNAPGQVTKLSKVTYSLNSGGPAYCSVLRNSSIVQSYSGLYVGVGAGTLDATDVYLQDGDSLAILVNRVENAPKDMSFTLFLDYIQ